MSRARDIADFNASLFADDEISGDKVSGGTIGAGTFNGTIGSSATFPSGYIVQTKFVAFDQQQTIGNGSSTGTTFVTIGSGVSGKEFSLNMAVSSGNIILGFGTVNLNANDRYSGIKIFADSDQIALGQSNGGMTRLTVSGQIAESSTAIDQYVMFNSSFSFSHTPSDTSSHTYKVQAGNSYASSIITYINRPHRTGDTNVYMHSGYSHFTIMEIAQ